MLVPMLALTFLLSWAYHHTRSKLQFLLLYLVDSPRPLFRCFSLQRSILQLQLGNDSVSISYTHSYFGGMSPHLLRIWISFPRRRGDKDVWFPFLVFTPTSLHQFVEVQTGSWTISSTQSGFQWTRTCHRCSRRNFLLRESKPKASVGKCGIKPSFAF